MNQMYTMGEVSRRNGPGEAVTRMVMSWPSAHFHKERGFLQTRKVIKSEIFPWLLNCVSARRATNLAAMASSVNFSFAHLMTGVLTQALNGVYMLPEIGNL